METQVKEIIKGDIWYITRNKNRMETTKCAQSSAEKGIKSYIVVADDDDLIIGASAIDLPVSQMVDIYGKENVSILSGHPPIPPNCLPKGCQ